MTKHHRVYSNVDGSHHRRGPSVADRFLRREHRGDQDQEHEKGQIRDKKEKRKERKEKKRDDEQHERHLRGDFRNRFYMPRSRTEENFQAGYDIDQHGEPRQGRKSVRKHGRHRRHQSCVETTATSSADAPGHRNSSLTSNEDYQKTSYRHTVMPTRSNSLAVRLKQHLAASVTSIVRHDHRRMNSKLNHNRDPSHQKHQAPATAFEVSSATERERQQHAIVQEKAYAKGLAGRFGLAIGGHGTSLGDDIGARRGERPLSYLADGGDRVELKMPDSAKVFDRIETEEIPFDLRSPRSDLHEISESSALTASDLSGPTAVSDPPSTSHRTGLAAPGHVQLRTSLEEKQPAWSSADREPPRPATTMTVPTMPFSTSVGLSLNHPLPLPPTPPAPLSKNDCLPLARSVTCENKFGVTAQTSTDDAATLIKRGHSIGAASGFRRRHRGEKSQGDMPYRNMHSRPPMVRRDTAPTMIIRSTSRSGPVLRKDWERERAMLVAAARKAEDCGQCPSEWAVYSTTGVSHVATGSYAQLVGSPGIRRKGSSVGHHLEWLKFLA